MAVYVFNYRAAYSVEVAEALAILHGLKLAIEVGLHHVVLESDSATVVQHIHSNSPILSKRICIRLKMTNKVAHDLTKFASSVEGGLAPKQQRKKLKDRQLPGHNKA
ncbi:hypothetical protein ACOSQ3_026286 [Xanthoceras sorbifolium]